MKIFDYFKSRLLEICNAPARAILVVSIFITGVFYIKSHEPVITIPGNAVQFNLPAFDACEVKFKDEVLVNSVKICQNKTAPFSDENDLSGAFQTKYGQLFKTLQFTNPYSAPGVDPKFDCKVVIFYDKALSCQISAVSTNGRPVDLKNFYRYHLKSNGKYEGMRYVREDVANILVYANDVISNWVLTFLVLGIITLSASLVKNECIYMLYSKDALEDGLKKKYKITDMTSVEARAKAFDEYIGNWFILNNRFRFLQTLGPAIGFIFTVSSLVAALAPALRDTNNLEVFMKGIHVAMVSTFLGLLLRIVAIESSRVNDALLIRVELILKSNEKK